MLEIAKALNAMQAELWGVAKGKVNPHFKSKYADLQKVWETIRSPLTKNGLYIGQFPCEAPVGHVGLRTVILHTSGESIEDKFFLPVKDPTNPQACMSALTYARRYALMGAVGVAPADDDGNDAAREPSEVRAEESPSTEALKQVDLALTEFNSATVLEDKKAAYLKMKSLAGIDRTRVTGHLTGMAKVLRDLVSKEKSDGKAS